MASVGKCASPSSGLAERAALRAFIATAGSATGALLLLAAAFTGGLLPALLGGSGPVQLASSTTTSTSVAIELDLARRVICPSCPEVVCADAGWPLYAVVLAGLCGLCVGALLSACCSATLVAAWSLLTRSRGTSERRTQSITGYTVGPSLTWR